MDAADSKSMSQTPFSIEETRAAASGIVDASGNPLSTEMLETAMRKARYATQKAVEYEYSSHPNVVRANGDLVARVRNMGGKWEEDARLPDRVVACAVKDSLGRHFFGLVVNFA